MHHQKKYTLKKPYKYLLKTILISFILIYMLINNPLKPLFKYCKNKYLKNNYLITNTNLKSKIAKSVFNDIDVIYKNKKENIKLYDDMFFVKEIKENKPIVYLYNTHQTEKYIKRNNMDYEPSVMNITSYLNEKLNDRNIPTMMEYRSISKVLSDNNWKYGYSYKVSRTFIEDAVSKNPSIKYLFDIHRDSGTHDSTTLCINDKCYAKVLFLVGLENPNYIENQKYAEELHKMVNNRVDKLSKGILQKQGKGVNGVYNQDFSSRTMLIEIGGENNYVEEVYNTLDILTDVIYEYIIKENNYGR